MDKQKKIVIGVTGGIAAYKALDLVSALVKCGHEVHVIMTKNATEFVTPLSFEVLSHNSCITDLFNVNSDNKIPHIALQDADAFIIAPASANIIAKAAYGLADDALTTSLIATKAPVIFAPAMNSVMFLNKKTQENLTEIKRLGYYIVEPITGKLACGVNGIGKLADTKDIISLLNKVLSTKKDYLGKKVLVTLGGTAEFVDGVRYITNKSSGKMGLAIAKEAYNRGAEVTIIKGNTSIEIDKNIGEVIEVSTTSEMLSAVEGNLSDKDYIIKAAAPGDYTVKNATVEKIKDENVVLKLTKNPDIAKRVGSIKKPNQKLIIFSAETHDLIENSKIKLKKKNADMVVANDVTKEGAGFNSDTNIATIITNNTILDLSKMLKSELATIILDEAALL